MSKRVVVAVDGPAGAGKSTVCRLLAEKLGFVYLDTGAIYRALGLVLYEEGKIVKAQRDDGFRWLEEPDINYLRSLPLNFSVMNNRLEIRYRNKLLDEELRLPHVSVLASFVARMQQVRSFATEIQREIGRSVSVVAEGRDSTTVVFPEACLKVYLTASVEERARRRLEDYKRRGVDISFEKVVEEITRRDRADSSRDFAPLSVASGAVIVDTSGMSIDEVVNHLIKLVHIHCRV
ncbi:(d)CMP kinase [Thermodesulforhabdus norvegica]|uniref:Cytidylate kinase n=1 Tax=Thermodesulforhabdus norvegica TaxID=39841 RepID=A0A1I4QGS8_9BACT|nr:(d)CMP kinase [Thermodesulforhabdus norvegica]SFM39322.1 cytidylate kinase [Thermodesulforhabdus norvegica]